VTILSSIFHLLGDIIYANGLNSNTRLAGNTTINTLFLSQTGTGQINVLGQPEDKEFGIQTIYEHLADTG
jgi:hypothetical protein